MRKPFAAIPALAAVAFSILACSPRWGVKEIVSSTIDNPWQVLSPGTASPDTGAVRIDLCLDSLGQVIEGFGVAFSELSWQSLWMLPEADRDAVLDELFLPGKGANLTVNRTPVGANDFSLDWYSYDEEDGDFGMEHFSVAHDQNTLAVLIQEALRRNPEMKIWASPWCPPSWMKRNHNYAMRPAEVNDLPESGRGYEGQDMFIQEDRYLEAYALYFEKYIRAYRDLGIEVGMVMPQNEPNSDQNFPSCCWTSAGLARFLTHLGPRMKELGVDVYFGTCERPNVALIDSVLTHPVAGPFISGVGFQWGGRSAVAHVRDRYPDKTLYMTEQECGNGRNDWSGALHSWDLMKHYLSNGVSVYDYWNLSLLENGLSRWGWRQNSLVTVNPGTRSYRFTIEYYLLKHVSHYVSSGARRIPLPSETDALAFLNPDGRVVLVVANRTDSDRLIDLSLGTRKRGRPCCVRLPARSFSTLVL